MQMGLKKGLKELSFIGGSWKGEGCIVDFTDPAYTMIFGSVQAVNGEGAVVHWETYRFEEKDGNVFLYPSQMGRESGTYLLNKDDGQERYVFEPFFNNFAPVKEIYFEQKNEGQDLVFGIKGGVEQQTFEKEWHLTKREP